MTNQPEPADLPDATEAQPQVPEPLAALLATPCATCEHTLNWHRHHVGCIARGCGCGRFEEQPDAEADLTAEQQVRGVQAWMALDLHQALGWPVDHGATVVHQGRKSWSDWWAELLAGVRNVQMMRRYRGEVHAPAAVSAAVAPPTSTMHGLSVQHADALWDAIATPGPSSESFADQHANVCRAVREILDDLAPAPAEPTPSHRAGLRDELAAAIWERQNPGRRWSDCEHPWGADAEADADAVLAVLYREWPWLRAAAEDAEPTDRAELRDRIAEALLDHLSRTADIRTSSSGGELAFMPEVTDAERMRMADAVLAVLPEPTGQATAEAALAGITAVQAADRAAVLHEVADELTRKANKLTERVHDLAYFVAKDRLREAEILDREATALRRMADETATEQCECGCGQPGELVHGRRLAIPEPAAGARQDGAES